MKCRKKRLVIILLLVCFLFGGLFVFCAKNPTILQWRQEIWRWFTYRSNSVFSKETDGLSDILNTDLYEDNHLIVREKPDFTKDNKKIYETEQTCRIVNYTDGYRVDFPRPMEFDFTKSPLFVKGVGQQFDVTISKEQSPYDDVEEYLSYFLNRFILNESYQTANRLMVQEEAPTTKQGNAVQIIRANICEPGDAKFDGYAYVFVKTDTRAFYRLMFRYDTKMKDFDRILQQAVENFYCFAPTGTPVYDVAYRPKEPANWTEETTALYRTIRSADDIRWGIFTADIYGEGIEKTVPALEKKAGYRFPVVLSYLQHNRPFPTAFMEKNYQAGKLVELTYQITGDNNQDLFGYTPNLDIYRGIKDAEIRKFAREAKAFGHPFLFRLNNEMNSDWTSYSGITNMSDPEIYVENWRRIYRIFEEEGVDNAIWIFNPNDHNYPPCNWNHFLAYYPGDEYVQIIGLTGYNTGTYYLEETGETWREFETIYDDVEARYQPFFAEFPWMITEFGTSSVGGDKVKWIDNMFACLDKYPNIKIAVWFSFADFDARPEKNGAVARPYWLDETPETLQAFARGVKIHGVQGWSR